MNFSPSRRRSLVALAAAALALAALPMRAQAGRVFPKNVERARIAFVDKREVFVNGQPERLSPGVQIIDQKGRVPLARDLKGMEFVVNCLRDTRGAIRRIWLLTPEEASFLLPGQRDPAGGFDPSNYQN